MLLPHDVRREASRAILTAGNSIATNTPIIAITTSSSTSVKPLELRRWEMDISRYLKTSSRQWRRTPGTQGRREPQPIDRLRARRDSLRYQEPVKTEQTHETVYNKKLDNGLYLLMLKPDLGLVILWSEERFYHENDAIKSYQ